MKALKQKDRKSCVACTACMITNTKLQDFYDFMKGKEPPYNDKDVYRYLLKYGYAMGIGFKNEKHRLKKKDSIAIKFKLKDFPAYVVVKSQRFLANTHAVYWDGERILDPNPDIGKDGLELGEYEILEWWPIQKMGGKNVKKT